MVLKTFKARKSGVCREKHAGNRRRLLGGDDGMRLAALAEDNSATWVIWVTRGPRGTPLPCNPADPFRERDRLARGPTAWPRAAREISNIMRRPSLMRSSVMVRIAVFE